MNILSADDSELRGFDVFTDVDQLESRKTGFRFNGKPFILRPMRLVDQIKLANASSRLDSLRTEKKVTGGDLVEIYWDLFNLACENVTRDDFDKMTLQQCQKIAGLIMEHAVSRIPMGLLEKKTAQRSVA